MAVSGSLRTMSLPDLWQWASVNRKSGGLELERNGVSRCVFFREGRLVGCSANDPPVRLGQFLYSRGKINRIALEQALGRQETEGKTLGLLLLEDGVLTQQELLSEVAAKARETIYGLFDWTDAVFRFDEDRGVDHYTIEIDLAMEEIMLNGLRRVDALRRIREVLDNSGIVPRRTNQLGPNGLEGSPRALKLLMLVDGRRTIAEILLHAHMPEFPALELLFELYTSGLVETSTRVPIPPGSTTILDPEPPTRALDSPADSPKERAAGTLRVPDSRGAQAIPRQKQSDPSAPKAGYLAEIDVAGRLVLRGEHDAALEVLNACCRAHPGDPYLRQLLAEGEAAFVSRSRQSELSPHLIPVCLCSKADIADLLLSPEEKFFLSLIDGQADIRSLLWISPMREVEILRTLQRMLHRGVIALRNPNLSGAGSNESSPVTVPA